MDGKWSFSGGQRTCGTHHSISIVCILMVFRCAGMDVGWGGARVHRFALDFGNGVVDIGNHDPAFESSLEV